MINWCSITVHIALYKLLVNSKVFWLVVKFWPVISSFNLGQLKHGVVGLGIQRGASHQQNVSLM